MGRKPKNTFTEATIAFEKETEFRLYDVKIPFVYSITVEINNPNLVKAQTTWECYARSSAELETIVKQIENDPTGFKVIKVKESTRIPRMPEFWLTFTHSRSKKCRIRQYVNTPYPAYKENDIDITKYLFPQVIGNLKRKTLIQQ
ncbi:MAG: hypothetical protein ACT4N5_05460 [Nitrosopumilaceae archaeon]